MHTLESVVKLVAKTFVLEKVSGRWCTVFKSRANDSYWYTVVPLQNRHQRVCPL
jgi:hypothetical protein